MRTKVLLLSICVTIGTNPAFSQIKAVTENGDNVLLYDDGTWKSADELFIDMEPHKMEKPPFNGEMVSGVGASKVSISLSMVSSNPNKITDDAKWFENNDLSLPVYEVPNTFMGLKGNLPDMTPTSFNGHKIIQAIYSEQYNFLIYGRNFSEGRYLIITDKEVGNVLHVLDFESYMLSPDFVEEDRMFIDQSINWVEEEDGILYISHGHNTYAASSKNMNAYITAIDLESHNLLWRTKPLICNTSNFVIYDDIIICGYGFTQEPDYLYTLSKISGVVAQKIPLKTGPDVIIRKENKLYVRTYNMDYVFEIKQTD